jgi:hypothetical protein
MKSEVLNQLPYTWMPVLAFFIFLSLFSFVIYWTFRKGSKDFYKNIGEIPFEEGSSTERRSS